MTADALRPDTWTETVRSLQRGLLLGSYVRTVNFHNTPRSRAAQYERQLAFCARHFASVDEDDLDRLFETGRWHKDRPGLLPIFFEGYRNNYDVAAPLAERYGFVGWFFLPTQFLGTPLAEQRAFAEAHHIGLVDDGYEDGRIPMTWDEVRELDRRHVIACHTRTHSRLDADAPDALLREEIVDSKAELEAELGHEVATFAWLFGSEAGVDARADRYLHEAGYRYLLSNLKIQKLR